MRGSKEHNQFEWFDGSGYLQRQRHVDNRQAVNILSQAAGLNADSISKSRPMAELLRSKV